MKYYVYKYKITTSDNWLTQTFTHEGCTDEQVKGWLKSKFGARFVKCKKYSEREMEEEKKNVNGGYEKGIKSIYDKLGVKR